MILSIRASTRLLRHGEPGSTSAASRLMSRSLQTVSQGQATSSHLARTRCPEPTRRTILAGTITRCSDASPPSRTASQNRTAALGLSVRATQEVRASRCKGARVPRCQGLETAIDQIPGYAGHVPAGWLPDPGPVGRTEPLKTGHCGALAFEKHAGPAPGAVELCPTKPDVTRAFESSFAATNLKGLPPHVTGAVHLEATHGAQTDSAVHKHCCHSAHRMLHSEGEAGPPPHTVELPRHHLASYSEVYHPRSPLPLPHHG